jgi:hypothetical protein
VCDRPERRLPALPVIGLAVVAATFSALPGRRERWSVRAR